MSDLLRTGLQSFGVITAGARTTEQLHAKLAVMRRARKFLVTLVPGEDGFIVAECPALPGCVSQGRTKAEALDNIREAIEASLLTRREMGLEPAFQVVEVKVAIPA